jgi:CubicO group peptidase (beta-lactamase class C family)
MRGLLELRQSAMDPPSIAAATASLVFTIVETGKTLATVFSEQETAPRCVLLFQTEFVVLAALLSQIQLVFHAPTVRRYPETLVRALELTLVGCDLTLSVLNKKIEGLRGPSSGEDIALEKREKASYIRNEGMMTQLLQQLQDKSSAVALLLKALDCWSLERMSMMVESGQQILRKVQEDIVSAHAAYPDERFARSLRDVSRHEPRAIYSLMEPVLPSSTPTPSQRVFLRGPRFTQSALPSSSSTNAVIGIPAGDEYESTMMDSRPHARRRGLRMADVRTPQSGVPIPSSLSPGDLFVEALGGLQRKMMAPAIAVGIVSTQGSSTYVQGIKKHGCAVSVSGDDRFGVAGISYMMITTVLAIFIEKGLLYWSTTIKDALPDMTKSIHPEHHKTTLEMLCAHVSGIETSVWEIDGGKVWDELKDLPGHQGRITVAEAVLAVPPAHTPGKTASWNENNVLIVALILEERCSELVEILLKRELFDPLKMYNTAADAVDTASKTSSVEEPTEPWPHAMSPDGENPIPREPASQAGYIPAAYQPLDNLHSSIPDLVKFFDLHLRGFLKQPTMLLSLPSFQKLHTPFLHTERTPGGWCSTTSDLRMVESFHGWSVSVSMVSSAKEAYICLANFGSAYSDFVPEEFKEIMELCMQRSPDIMFQNTAS